MSSEKNPFDYDDSQPQYGLFDDCLQRHEDFMESSGPMTPLYDWTPEFGAIDPIQGDEVAYAFQTSKIQPIQAALQPIHNDGVLSDLQNEVQPSRNENSMTREKGYIFVTGTESDARNSKGKSTLDSVPLTPKERKKRNDQNYRRRKRVRWDNLQDEVKYLRALHTTVQQGLYQPICSFEKRKAMFELNFRDRESMKKAMNKVLDLPDLKCVHLKVEERRLKVEGNFDTDAVLHELNKVCPQTHLLSKSYAIAGSSMPGPSTAAK